MKDNLKMSRGTVEKDTELQNMNACLRYSQNE